MSLGRGDFAAFFKAVRPGQRPFDWQERLLDTLLENGCWPDRVVAPTGTGKTAVVDVHVFANALVAATGGPRLPRRLALVVDRRFVVDSHDEHARAVAVALKDASDGILRIVAQELRGLRIHVRVADGVTEPPPAPLLTARLRGGTPPPRSWRDQPEACAVLACTPDMFGSRLLLQGYGSSPRAWPREAGLLAFDTAVVVDEAHLSRQLLRTARRVAELLDTAEVSPSVPRLQVVETTATPEPGPGLEVGVEEADLVEGGTLKERLTRPKPVGFLPLSSWPAPDRGAARADAVAVLVEAVAGLRAEFGPTVGCVVNRVALAVDMASALRERGLTVEMLCGRLRPADVTRLRRLRPHLLDIVGDDKVDVLVATQTVEVGVDLDLAAMVSDLAPGPALAQRVGRVNRLGHRELTRVLIAVPEGEVEEGVAGPYERDDLVAARQWLQRRAEDQAGLSPWRLRDDPPPPQKLRRSLLQRAELADSWQWARTSDDLFARPDLALWLDDDLANDRDVGVVARGGLPTDTNEAVSLLRLLLPRPHEVYPASLQAGRRLVEKVLERAGEGALLLRVRRDEVAPILEQAGADLRPGDVLVVDAAVPFLRGGVVSLDGQGHEQPADDVLEHGESVRRPGGVVLRVGSGSLLPDGLAAVDDVLRDDEPDWPLDRRRRLADGLERLVGPAAAISTDLGTAVRAGGDLLRRGRVKDADVVVRRDRKGQLMLVVVDLRRASADEDLRQTWTPRSEPVALEDHQEAVAVAAADLASHLGLGDDLREWLRLAGLHHDDGKGDRRFQSMLGAEEGRLLAKSGRRGPRQEARAKAASGLPMGWRHEQLSALLTWRALAGHGLEERETVTRLVGTTHGHGRIGFPHAAAGLVVPGEDPGDDARELFDEGVWDELVESTDRRYGVWGFAFLEAVLRAADGRVSRAGS